MRNPLTRSPSKPAAGQRGSRKGTKKDPSRTAQAAEVAARAAGDLRTFTIDFFSLFGATVAPLNADPHGPLRITMSGDLAEHFATESVGLAFQSIEPGSGHQLVAHGSRWFDRMQAWLDRRSALTVRRLPVRVTGSEQLMHAIKPLNAGVVSLKLGEVSAPLFVFHWRMTYRADDKREELYSVVLDDSGVVWETGALPDGLPKLRALLDASEPAPVLAPPPVRRRKVAQASDSVPAPGAEATVAELDPEPDESDIGLESGWPSASADDAPAVSPNGQRLPAMTQLVRLAERARRFAVYHADQRCVEHEADILPRLYKSVERLSTYYSQQIEELATGSGEKLDALRADLERKVAEEVENHRLRVLVDLTGYAVIYRPTAFADLTLGDGARQAPLRVQFDRFSGELLRPACYSCGKPITGAVLCRSSHVVCDDCLRQCGECGDVLCATCGVAPCSTCGKLLCSSCASTCQACGEAACPEHIGRCPVCGDEVCDSCRTPCAECGTEQCHSHLRADAVLLPEDEGSPRLICSRCSTRCPSCRQYSARLKTCELSGQRFCANCVATCVQCGRAAGPGFFKHDRDGRTFCRDCATLCPVCGEISDPASQRVCSTCGNECCRACALKCAVCHKVFCREHAVTAAGCGHALCVEHALVCSIGGEPVCPKCGEQCAICGQSMCEHHKEICSLCGERYCSGCVDPTTEVCATCRTALTEGVEVDITKEPAGRAANAWLFAYFMRWRKASNRKVTVYVGQNSLMATLLIAKVNQVGKFKVKSRDFSLASIDRLRRER